MRLKIVSDGTPLGTRVSGEGGKPLHGITAVQWALAHDGHAVAHVELALTEIEASADEVRCYGPAGKEVRRIEYTDGTVVEYPNGLAEEAAS